MIRLLYDNSIWYRVGRHLLFFCLTVLFFTLIFFMQSKQEFTFISTLWVTFINALFFFGYAYLTIFILIPEFLFRQRFLLFAVFFLIIGIGLSAIKLIISGHIFYSDIAPENIENSGFVNLRFILVNTKDMSFIVALFCVIKYARDFMISQSQMATLTKKNLEDRNKLLQLKFDPHFLFNTMNNLYSLSLTDMGKTLIAVKRFRMVMGYLVDESRKQFADLGEELELVKNFIELQALRYGDRLRIELTHSGTIEGIKLPSMVLFFLTENCYRHGSSTDAGNPWIKLNIIASNEHLIIVTRNSKPSGSVSSGINNKKGSFFTNLSNRLSILLGENGYSLKITDKADYFEVILDLKNKELENRR